MTTAERRTITADDLLELATLSDLALTPDGQLAVFVVGKPYDQKKKRSPRQIMAVSLEDGACRPFSAGTSVDEMPRWSPDGTVLAFLSDRPHGLPEDAHAAPSQIYLLPRGGGEARRLTAVGGEIHDFGWSPDGSRLYLLSTEPETAEARQRRSERGDSLDFEKEPRYWRLWSVDLQSGEARACTPPGLQVWEFALSADSTQAVLVASDLPYEWSWYQARLELISLDDSESSRTIHATSWQIASPRFSPDGRTIAVTSCVWSDRGYYGGDVLLIPVDGSPVHHFTDGHPVSVLEAAWEADGASLLCFGYEEGESALWRLSVTGELRTLWRAPVSVGRNHSRLCRAGNTIAVLRSDPEHPIDLWVAQISEDSVSGWRQISSFHPQVQEWALASVRTLQWRATDGVTIQGLLALPPDYQEPTALPLVVVVHGGPAGLFTFDFLVGHWMRILTAAGFAVLMPNPRGSVGWGSAFTMANLGDMGGADFQDIMAGVDQVVAQGIADPARLAIAGWSYGGFMTAWAVTRTDRFKAAIMGAGLSDWRSFHGVSNIPTWDAIFYGTPGYPADPYESTGIYARFSPLTHIDRVTTPTLILHGEKDECVPVGQGYQYFRALRERGIPVEMTVYPRAGHGPLERPHVKDIQLQAVEWCTRYLGGTR